MKALIDGDILVYSIGFAANDDPVEYALHSVNVVIDSILEVTEAEEYFVYLTGSGNYRDKVATILPYKGNRIQSEKPVHYGAIREYLEKKHEAIVVDGMEADDAMAMAQWKDPEGNIICTLDKDLKMVRGHHYNWRKGEVSYITLTEGWRHFYTQMLTGDSTDNIKGCYGIGAKKAEKILAEFDKECDMKCAVGYHYATCKFKGMEYEDPEAAFYENARLLWMSRDKPDDCLEWIL